MSNRAKVFLSSPMPNGDTRWEDTRDSIDALFKHGPLSAFFSLDKIDTEGGDTPDEIYLNQVAESQVLITIFRDNIGQGQRKEILLARKLRIPIISIHIGREKLEESTDIFIKGIVYDTTRVHRCDKLAEALDFIMASISGMIHRRLKQAIIEKKNADRVAENPGLVTEGRESIIEFCQYCLDQNNIKSAVRFAEQLNQEFKLNFLLKMTLYASSNHDVKATELDRLNSFAPDNMDAVLIKCLFSLNKKLFDVDDTACNAEIKGKLGGYISSLYEFLEIQDHKIEAGKLIEAWESLKEIRKIQVCGLFAFEPFCDSIQSIIEHRKLNVNVDGFLPAIDKCLNCMPRDSGEWVIIYPKVGGLDELVLESLESANQEIPWHNYNLFCDASCNGCGSPVEIYETVYSDFPDLDEA